MAEQDRYGSHLGTNPPNKESHLPSPPQGSGAEQDRFGGWFGGGKGSAAAKEVSDKLPQTSGAEQDRFGGWFGGGKGAGAAKEVSDRLPQASGAEQDRFGGWFGGGKGSAAAKEASDKLPKPPQASGAEQVSKVIQDHPEMQSLTCERELGRTDMVDGLAEERGQPPQGKSQIGYLTSRARSKTAITITGVTVGVRQP